MEKDFVFDALCLSKDSIRLLQILPGSPTEEIHCQINQFPTSECPDYCAVSYCWGDPDQPKRIILNQRHFLVHQNLWWLLYHLRLSGEERKLWIDAICIDQASVTERNHQVGLMGIIYKRADTVLAWLGRGSEDSEMALDLLMNGYRDKHDIDDGVWAALANLCRRAYWYRTWIIQELLLASKVDLLCGDIKVRWKELEHIADFMPSGPLKLIEASGVAKTLTLADSLPFRFVEQRAKRQRADLRTLLQTYQDSKCIDPRDKVYAMLSLASDCRTSEALVADYSKDLCEVYVDVMQFCSNISSRERLRFSFLLLKILDITPGMAADFLNQRYRSGRLPLETMHRFDHLKETLGDEDRATGSVEVCGKYVGSISGVHPNLPPKAHGGRFPKKWYSEVVNLFSKFFVGRAVTFSHDPITASAIDCDADAEPGRITGAGSGFPTKITILSNQFRRSTGIACGEARIGYYVYQFDKSGLALVCDETEWGIKVVGEAILPEYPEFSIDGGGPDIHRFRVDAADLLALTQRGSTIDSDDGDGWTALSVAGWRRSKAVAHLLLENDAEVGAGDKDGDGRMMLRYAACNGHKAVVRLLLEMEQAYYPMNKTGETALQVAAANGHEAVVRLLLEKGAVVDEKDKGGQTAVHKAATNGHRGVVRLLLEGGAITDEKDKGGQAAIHKAAANGDEVIVRLLLEKRAAFNAKEEDDRRALLLAAAKGREEVVRLLLASGQPVHEKDGVEQTLLQVEFTNGLEEFEFGESAICNGQGGVYDEALLAASVKGHEKVVELLLSKGADVNAQGRHYGKVLPAASYGGHEKIVELLLSKGADVGNALQAALTRGHEKIVELLLSNGANVGNALQAASTRGDEKTVELLLSKGTDINAQSSEYGNALQAASTRGHEKIVELLLSKGADVDTQGEEYGDTLQAAIDRGHEKIAELLLSKSADVNTQGRKYGNALQAASIRCNEKIVELLLNKGAEINTQGGEYGNALQAASLRGHEKIAKLLLSKGADVNAQGGEYGNALQAASEGGNEKVVELLLSKGADVNAQGGWYGNALQAASERGNEKIVDRLLSKGADVNAHGGWYGNALQAAMSEGEKKIAEILLSKGAEQRPPLFANGRPI